MGSVPSAAQLGNRLSLSFVGEVVAEVGPREEIAALGHQVSVELGREVVDEHPTSVARPSGCCSVGGGRPGADQLDFFADGALRIGYLTSHIPLFSRHHGRAFDFRGVDQRDDAGVGGVEAAGDAVEVELAGVGDAYVERGGEESGRAPDGEDEQEDEYWRDRENGLGRGLSLEDWISCCLVSFGRRTSPRERRSHCRCFCWLSLLYLCVVIWCDSCRCDEHASTFFFFLLEGGLHVDDCIVCWQIYAFMAKIVVRVSRSPQWKNISK